MQLLMKEESNRNKKSSSSCPVKVWWRTAICLPQKISQIEDFAYAEDIFNLTFILAQINTWETGEWKFQILTFNKIFL